jgi:serine/threonine protein kinase
VRDKQDIIGERIGDYEIRRLLGRGGMGAVYLAHDHALDRRVALKILPSRLSGDPDVVARFQREAMAMAKVRHPNLMHIYSVGEHKGHPFFAMEYIKGSTLSSIIREAGCLPAEQAVHILAEIISALAKVHGRGLIHRDIKPGNVMIDEDGRAVLMDFGLAREESDVGLTADHTVLGTPNYMSPEQARGGHIDSRSDIYSLGVVLYEMLAGAPPFKGKTSYEILRQQIETPIPAPSVKNPDAPQLLDQVVARATAKDPAERHQTVQEMAADLVAAFPMAPLVRLIGGSFGVTAPTVLPGAPTGSASVPLGATARMARTVPSKPTPGQERLRRTVFIWGSGVAGVALAALLAWAVFGPDEPAERPAPGAHWVRLVGPDGKVRSDPDGDAVAEGWLVETLVIDEVNIAVKIRPEGHGRIRTWGVKEGDSLHVIHDR